MRFFAIIISGLICTTCTTKMSQNLTSGWSVLRDTSSVKCTSWPLRDGELALDNMLMLPGGVPGFVAEVRMRNQSRRIAHANFAGSEAIDTNAIETIPLPSGAQVLGSAQWYDKQYVAVSQMKNGKTVLDLRQFPRNIVQFSGASFGHPIAAARLAGGNSGVWMTYKVGAENRSVEETPAALTFLKAAGKSDLAAKMFAINFGDFPALLPQKGTSTMLAIWQDVGEGGGKFKIAKFNEDGSVAGPQQLALPVNHAVESWAAVVNNNYNLLAYVDGDSMVGQASIKIAKISWNETVPVVNWVRTRSLSDIHVADPVWVAGSENAYLLIPKWVDEENTVASYKVGADDIDAMAASGVFPKGTRVESGFYDIKNAKVYAVLRQRASVGWRYDLCQLKDI